MNNTVKAANRLLVNKDDVLRVAITQDASLLDLDIERPDITQIKGNIYKGKISSIEPSLAAVFVDFGRERHGFMPFKEISPEYFNKDLSEDDIEGIAKVLKIGQPIIVQVEKEERGSKGAALTTYLSLAGSYLVLMPNNPKGGGISRRIEGEEREQLRAALDELTMPEGMSVIIRTAGVNKSAKELQWDLDSLLTYFDALKQAATMDRAAPYLIHQESNVLIRTLRDYMRGDIDEIILDDQAYFDEAHAYMKQVRPELADRVKLYEDKQPLFSRYQIESQIESSYAREIRLPSGGSIVIDQTEALVAIDVNSSRATRGKSIEETAFNTNVEAAREVARQLRLRDLGGLIIVDFIDMNQYRHQREVENVLKEAVANDRARIQLTKISRFGLLEMSRQRLRSGTNKNIRNSCPRCEGTGLVRSVESLSRTITHLLEEQASQGRTKSFQVRVPVSVATHLANERRENILSIENNNGVRITVLPCTEMSTPQYEIRPLKADGNQHAATPSYKLLKSEKAPSKRTVAPSITKEQPRIEQFLKTKQDKVETSSGGLFGFIKRIFGSDAPAKSEPVTTKRKKPATKKANTRSKSTNTRTANKKSTGKQNSAATDKKPARGKNAPAKTRTPRNQKSDDATRQTKAKSTKPQVRKTANKAKTPKNEMDELALENNLSMQETDKQIKPKAPQKRKRATSTPKEKAPKQEAAQSTEAETTPKKKATPVQAHVEQRPMKAGKRVSPKTDKPKAQQAEKKQDKPKATYKPGRKIVEAPAEVKAAKAKQEAEKKPAASYTYTPGRKIIDSKGGKVENKSDSDS